MSKISKEKEERIMANIIGHLYQYFPQALFASEISKLEARDEEFVKRLLNKLKNKNMVTEIRKNPKGREYKKRLRWRLSDAAYTAYKRKQFQ